jgi:Tol biopolymer transport system component
MRVPVTACSALLMALVGVMLSSLVWVAAQDDGPPILTGRIAFVSDEDNNPGDIYAMDVIGNNRVRLTNDAAYDGHPSWSPDGEEIAFWSRRARDPGDIYAMQANGQGVMRLTRHAACDSLPAWSPDGTQIAFVRVREGVSSRLYVVPASGGTPVEAVEAEGWTSEPAWCPVSEELAFVLASGRSNWGDVWFADAGNGTILRKWRYQGIEMRPTWSRDGSMICCSHSNRPNGAHADLVIFDLERGDVIQLTNTDARETEPDWWAPSQPAAETSP